MFIVVVLENVIIGISVLVVCVIDKDIGLNVKLIYNIFYSF